MKIGMIGLGRMGANMAGRLLAAGHEVVGFNRNPERLTELVKQGAVIAVTCEELIEELDAPRVIWLMISAAAVEPVIENLRPRVAAGDVIVDAGNSHFQDDLRRAQSLAADGIHFVDVGTSGGVWGRERGYCQMVGGEREIVQRIEPILAALAPPVAAAPRTPGRSEEPAPEEHGYLPAGGTPLRVRRARGGPPMKAYEDTLA